MIKISNRLAYLLGLLTGRGHIFVDSRILAIEFSHTNEFVYGIAYCPKCGFLATKQEKNLICKNCSTHVNPKSRKIYNQPKSTIESLRFTIIPFIKKEINVVYDIIGNKSMTLLVMDFKNNKKQFNFIRHFFGNANSFDNFYIPKEINTAPKKSKIEFVNGLLDTSGFPSPGGWLNRDGKRGYGRMRVYFQIVRNWHLPVEIDNFLRKGFALPVHTIDWGHPNIRDANLQDFFNTRPTSWSREHQVKFFPEYYKMFHFRIKCKQELFQELFKHNKDAIFTNKEDWFPPKPIGPSKIKPYHPGEKDLRIPKPARRHFDAFWQINLVMGCFYLRKLMKKAKNPKCFFLIGKDIDCKPLILERKLDKRRKEITDKIFSLQSKKKDRAKKLPIRIDKKRIKEWHLYDPIASYLYKYLVDKYKEKVETFNTSSTNLNLFLKNKELLEIFDYCEKFRIRPDIVGFLTFSKRIIFIEVKITNLDLKCLGQLLGYCLVAKPEEAILISSQKPSISLLKILKARPDLLEYDKGKRVKIGEWKRGNFSFLIV